MSRGAALEVAHATATAPEAQATPLEGELARALERIAELSTAQQRDGEASEAGESALQVRLDLLLGEREALYAEIAQLQVELQWQKSTSEAIERRRVSAIAKLQEQEQALSAVLLRDGRDRMALLAEIQANHEAHMMAQQAAEAALAVAHRRIGALEAELAQENANTVEARATAEEQIALLRGEFTMTLRRQVQYEVDLQDLRRRHALLAAEKERQDELLHTLMQRLTLAVKYVQNLDTLPGWTEVESLEEAGLAQHPPSQKIEPRSRKKEKKTRGKTVRKST